MVLDVQDSEDQNLIRMFPQCVLIKRLLLSAPDRTDFFRAKEFIDQAIASGGTAFVHCNGTLIDLIGRALITEAIHRRHQSRTFVCHHVHNAAPQVKLGRRIAPRSKSTVLHLTEWRVPYANKSTPGQRGTRRILTLGLCIGVRVDL